MIGRSIYEVVVIDGSLYSRFYGSGIKVHGLGGYDLVAFMHLTVV